MPFLELCDFDLDNGIAIARGLWLNDKTIMVDRGLNLWTLPPEGCILPIVPQLLDENSGKNLTTYYRTKTVINIVIERLKF